MTVELLIQSVIVVPALGALLIPFAGDRHANVREFITIVSSILLFVLVHLLYLGTANGEITEVTIIEPFAGVSLALAVEPLGILFALVSSFLWIVTSVYSIGYMRANKEYNQTRFYSYFALALGSTMGVAFSANMFTLFVFYELLTLTTYPLVTHSGTDEARQAGRLYLGYLLGTSIVLQLLAIIWTWQITGTLEFRQGGVFDQDVSTSLIVILFLLYVFGIGKAAVMPFHRWLPAAMVAPIPVSALLHAVAVVKAGVFVILKIIVYLFGIKLLQESSAHIWVLYIASATVIIASLIALTKDNLKALLAYSTVSQLSYVIVAAVVLAPLSIAGAAMHIVAHAFGKITLFFAAGSIYTASHKTEISQLDGIGYSMPWTMAAFTIGSLSMIGIPPTAGFLSKWFILQGAFDVQNWLVVMVLIVSTLLNAGYFLPIVYAAFFRKPPDNGHQHGEAPFPVLIALGLSAAGTIALFIMPERILSLIGLIMV